MKRIKVLVSGLVLAGSLLLTHPVLADGPVPLSPSRRTALVVVQGAQWGWNCMYQDAQSIYGGVRYGYRVGTGAASRFLTPRWAR